MVECGYMPIACVGGDTKSHTLPLPPQKTPTLLHLPSPGYAVLWAPFTPNTNVRKSDSASHLYYEFFVAIW